MKRLVLLWVLIISIGLSQAYVHVKHDEFEEVTTYLMMGNVLGKEGMLSGSVALNLVAAKPDDGSQATYGLAVQYSGSDWIFLESGESLIFLIDGERVSLHTPGSVNRDVSGSGGIRETLIYPITPELVKEIISATEVKAKIKGEYSLVRFFTPVNFGNFKDFYYDHMTEEKAPPEAKAEARIEEKEKAEIEAQQQASKTRVKACLGLVGLAALLALILIVVGSME